MPFDFRIQAWWFSGVCTGQSLLSDITLAVKSLKSSLKPGLGRLECYKSLQGSICSKMLYFRDYVEISVKGCCSHKKWPLQHASIKVLLNVTARILAAKVPRKNIWELCILLNHVCHLPNYQASYIIILYSATVATYIALCVSLLTYSLTTEANSWCRVIVLSNSSIHVAAVLISSRVIWRV